MNYVIKSTQNTFWVVCSKLKNNTFHIIVLKKNCTDANSFDLTKLPLHTFFRKKILHLLFLAKCSLNERGSTMYHLKSLVCNVYSVSAVSNFLCRIFGCVWSLFCIFIKYSCLIIQYIVIWWIVYWKFLCHIPWSSLVTVLTCIIQTTYFPLFSVRFISCHIG